MALACASISVPTVWWSGAAGLKGPSYLPLNGIIFTVTGTEQVPLALVPPWVPKGGDFALPRYYKTGNYCVLSGSVQVPTPSQWTDTANVIAVLPEECRPIGGRVSFATNQNSHMAVIDVSWTGEVIFISGVKKEMFLSLEGIAFYTNAFTNKLKLERLWNHTLHSYRYAAYQVENELCALTGSVTARVLGGGGNFTNLIAVLPKECRPSDEIMFGVSVNNKTLRVDLLPNGKVRFTPPPDSNILQTSCPRYCCYLAGWHSLPSAHRWQVRRSS